MKVDEGKAIGQCTVEEIFDHLGERHALHYAVVILYSSTDDGMNTANKWWWAARAAASDAWKIVAAFKELVEELEKPEGLK